MIKRLELVGPSCLTSAADDEPVFVLRANDELAPDVVRRWAESYRVSKGIHWTTQQQKKYEEALALAESMYRWRIGLKGSTEVRP